MTILNIFRANIRTQNYLSRTQMDIQRQFNHRTWSECIVVTARYRIRDGDWSKMNFLLEHSPELSSKLIKASKMTQNPITSCLSISLHDFRVFIWFPFLHIRCSHTQSTEQQQGWGKTVPEWTRNISCLCLFLLHTIMIMDPEFNDNNFFLKQTINYTTNH